MNESTKLILSGLGGGVLVLSAMFGLDKADIAPPADDPQSPAISADCPEGWADTSKEVDHAVVLSCETGDWLVILLSDGTFSHGLQKNTPGAQFVFDPAGVPGWPD